MAEIEEWRDTNNKRSAREASRITGVNFKTISYHCIRETKRPHSIKYIFKFKEVEYK